MKPRGLLLTLAAVVVLLGGVAIWYFGAGGRSAPASQASATGERRIAVAPKVPGVMLVNDTRDAHLGPATPMFAECVLTNPTTGDIAITASALTPEVRGADGAPVAVTWERVGDLPPVIAAGASVGIRWVATSRMPAGSYEVVAAGAPGTAAPAVARVLVDPARITVSGVGDADEDEAAAIRLLAWRGQSADALARIEAVLAATPDALVMQLWRADLLEDLGRRDEAAAQFRQLAAAIDVRQRAKPGFKPELPYWLADRMAPK